MDAFSYLSVLLSIIVGLAITQVLQGYRALLLGRAHVRLAPAPLIWSVIILIIATQTWWSCFYLIQRTSWTFVTFGAVLLQTVLLYMIAAVVLPDVPRGEPLSLADHYERERVPLFVILLALLAVSIGKERLLEGRMPLPENLAFHGLFALVAAIGLGTRKPLVHLGLALLTVGLMLSYIALMFARL